MVVLFVIWFVFVVVVFLVHRCRMCCLGCGFGTPSLVGL